MGYYTNFEVTIEAPAHTLQAIKDYINEVSGEQLDWGTDTGTTSESTKWYDCEYDMRLVSQRYPFAYIEVHGKGEEPSDLWRIYVTNGQTQKVEAFIAYPECTLKRYEAPEPVDLELPSPQFQKLARVQLETNNQIYYINVPYTTSMSEQTMIAVTKDLLVDLVLSSDKPVPSYNDILAAVGSVINWEVQE